MASCITAQWSGSVCPQARLTITESSSTDTTATLSWTLEYVAHGYEARTNGVLRDWSVIINGSTVASGQYDIDHVTNVRTIKSGTTTINKSTSYQTISFSLSFGFNLTWSGVYGGTKTASGSIGVSAKTSYTISYNANGGSGSPISQTKWAGDTIYLSGSYPSRTGYTFKGWSTSTDSSVEYYAGSAYSVNASVTLYAVWQAYTYTVSYNANGGSGAPSSQTKTYGVNLTLSGTRPTRTNYNFLGWGTSSSSTSVAYSPGSTYSSNSGITLYAIWQLAYVKPRIWGLSADRCNSSGTMTDEGTYAKVIFSWATDKPVSSIKIEYKDPSSSTWTAVSVTGSGTSGSVSKIIGGSFSTETNHNVRITVSDSVGSNNAYTDIPYLNYIIDIRSNGKGVSIGKPANEDGFNVGMMASFDKPVNIGGKVDLWSDGDGGNISITAPNGASWNVNAFNGNFRLYLNENNSGNNEQVSLLIFNTDGSIDTQLGRIVTSHNSALKPELLWSGDSASGVDIVINSTVETYARLTFVYRRNDGFYYNATFLVSTLLKTNTSNCVQQIFNTGADTSVYVFPDNHKKIKVWMTSNLKIIEVYGSKT